MQSKICMRGINIGSKHVIRLGIDIYNDVLEVTLEKWD